MTEYQNQFTDIGGSISNGTLLGQGKIHLYFTLKDNIKRLILNLNNMYYLLNSPSNLVSLAYLNDNDIYHDIKNEVWYYLKTFRILAQAK